jgi:hypothetical protein
MEREALKALILLSMGMVGALLPARSALAQQEPAVNAGVEFLKRSANRGTGEAAMIGLGLMKAEVPSTDPTVQRCMAQIRARVNSEGIYAPEMGAGPGTYEAGVSIMALATEDAVQNRPLINTIAKYLCSRQNANGSWDYAARDQGDTSISQYAVLGLWEAENAASPIPPVVWDRAATWYMSVQAAGGSWNYHRDDPSEPETCSMTAAGIGSLLICQRQLERYRHLQRDTSSLLKPLVTEAGPTEYHPTTSNVQMERAIARGLTWLTANFNPSAPIAGHTPYYMLYGIERIGALADRPILGRGDWYTKGREFIVSSQHSDGSWHSQHGIEMNTVWAILFIVKSTAKTMKRIQIKRLGAGTLLGGRELPKDLTSMTVAGGRVVSRPMNGAIEGMLAALEDPRGEQGDAAVSGLVDRYYREGPDVLRPYKVRFRKMLADRDPGVRSVALWALSHTADLDVVPLLIDVVGDPGEDDVVVGAARLGLQLMSRKIGGMGPPAGSTPEQRTVAARKWREWYNAIRPLDLDDDDELPSAPSRAAAPAPAPAGAPATAPADKGSSAKAPASSDSSTPGSSGSRAPASGNSSAPTGSESPAPSSPSARSTKP